MTSRVTSRGDSIGVSPEVKGRLRELKSSVELTTSRKVTWGDFLSFLAAFEDRRPSGRSPALSEEEEDESPHQPRDDVVVPELVSTAEVSPNAVLRAEETSEEEGSFQCLQEEFSDAGGRLIPKSDFTPEWIDELIDALASRFSEQLGKSLAVLFAVELKRLTSKCNTAMDDQVGFYESMARLLETLQNQNQRIADEAVLSDASCSLIAEKLHQLMNPN